MSVAPPSYSDTPTTSPTAAQLFPTLVGQRIILCSSSPRRLALLTQLGLPVEVIASGFEENLSKSDYDLTPWEYATATATEKILAVYRSVANDRHEPRLLLASDTIILCGHQILEKPTSPDAHLAMLKQLRGVPHKVFTAVAALAPNDEMPVAPGYVLRTHLAETTVTFDASLSDDVLVEYVKSGEGSDKAGGYAIQGQGAVLVDKIEGSYDAVVGLPLNATYKLIHEVLNYDIYAAQDGEEEEDEGDEEA
ncbi:protein of unknown function [Taphrina deformans PYCC 5710]|uniref:Uncharacterized protein n=1 Tax=Taphrina deformans (strain PYCC 5710 / ATCC 11124 / CBS 356.35 / IMI 108563 / JCM 9778 / NBRC 8474) TaxID=1097556 RepID=R4XEC8_TAPDE|nr:protein of unknown function [Taphrina deformans PYCC 5710]|eukprot:CCG84182.1 protein of unknown function [Taphrina deformans PYCC 5710]